MKGGGGVAQRLVPRSQVRLQLIDALAGLYTENLGLFPVAEVSEPHFDGPLTDLDTGEDFTDLNRLGQVVIGPSFEPGDNIDVAASSR